MTSGCTVTTSEHNPNQVRSTNLEIIKALLAQHEACASGYQKLENGYEYWTYSRGGKNLGCIAFVKTGLKIIVPGLPIVEKGELKSCLKTFMISFPGHDFIFVGVENKFIDTLRKTKLRIDSVLIGQQPEWYSPNDFEEAAFKNIRRQVRRALNKRIEIEHLNLAQSRAFNHELSISINGLVRKWRHTRGLDTFGFMVQPEVNLQRGYGHIFLARRDGVLTGLLSCIPTPGDKGWYFEDLIRTANAPNGTIESLLVRAFSTLHTTDTSFITLGMVPLHASANTPATRGSLGFMLKMVKRIGGCFYNFEGLHTFKSRFRPQTWTDMHIVTIGKSTSIMDLLAVGKVLANGSIISFIKRSALMRTKRTSAATWRWVLISLLAPLIPWTVLLASCDGDYWLGSVSIQWAWVTFDVLLGLGLMGLINRLGTKTVNQFALILAGTTLADSILSTVQALSLHNQVEGFAQLFVGAGVFGPALATLTLLTLAWVNPKPDAG
jgi:phosphatidylglycerol lysyltransferase